MIEFEPPLRLHLDGDALVANWRFLQRQGKAACGAAVKADGYGLGAREVVTRLRDAGCRDFFVAHWGEASAIADLVPPEWISVLNGIQPADIPLIQQLGAIPVLNTPNQITMWKASGGGKCHVMIDTGINRLGIGPEQISSDLFDGLELDILLSHLASADEDNEQNAAQLVVFADIGQDIICMRRSLSNSAGIMLGANYHFDLTRPGLSLYGGIARLEMAGSIQPVVRLFARILQVRQLEAGDRVGYNGRFSCPTQMPIGTVSTGYADGYLRAFAANGSASDQGQELPVIGRVSMDLVTIDISMAPSLKEGDWVEMNYDLAQASSSTGLSQYELLTNLGTRFNRRWT
jgi:alanine racemase